MHWSEIPWRPAPSTLRQFAALWLVFFTGLAVWHGVVRDRPVLGWGLAGLAGGVGLLGVAGPAAVRLLFVGWMVLAFPVGWLVSRVVLAGLFYGLFTPLGLCFRLLGRDLLGQRRPTAETCWEVKPQPGDVETYLQQF